MTQAACLLSLTVLVVALGALLMDEPGYRIKEVDSYGNKVIVKEPSIDEPLMDLNVVCTRSVQHPGEYVVYDKNDPSIMGAMRIGFMVRNLHRNGMKVSNIREQIPVNNVPHYGAVVRLQFDAPGSPSHKQVFVDPVAYQINSMRYLLHSDGNHLHLAPKIKGDNVSVAWYTVTIKEQP